MKAVLIIVFFLLTPAYAGAGENADEIRVRIITHTKIMGFSAPEKQQIEFLVRSVKEPVVLYLMERRLLEGVFKRKAHIRIVRTMQKVADVSEWSLSLLHRCFTWKKDSHLQVALTFILGAVDSGMNREVFRALCEHLGKMKMIDVTGLISLVKTATLFSIKGFTPEEAVKVVEVFPLEKFSSFHFTLVSELTLLGVRAGLSPAEAISRARDLFTTHTSPRTVPAGYRR